MFPPRPLTFERVLPVEISSEAPASAVSAPRPGPKVGVAGEQWFCVYTQPKHEHIAAESLRRQEQLEVFLPRIRYRRPSRTEVTYATEPLFPRYFFVRFEIASSLRRVKYCRGIRDVVHFGDRWPAVPDEAVEQLRAAFGPQAVVTVAEDLRPGDPVRITGGVFHGLEAVLTRFEPARRRAQALLDFLGRQAFIEIDSCRVVLRDEGGFCAARFSTSDQESCRI